MSGTSRPCGLRSLETLDHPNLNPPELNRPWELWTLIDPLPSRNLRPPENALVAYFLCKCTSRHSPSTSSKTIREIDCQWPHSVRSSSLAIEHPEPPFDHKSLLSWPSVTSCRFPLANITLHNLLLIATILHDLVPIVTGKHQPPNPPWNPNKLLTDRKKMYPKMNEKHLFSHIQWISWFFWIDMKSFRIFS